MSSFFPDMTPPGDPRLAHLPLMGSPVPITVVICGYIYFATSLGPRLMKNREAFQLREVLFVYNLLMVTLSITQFIRGGIYGWFGTYSLYGGYSYTCQPVDYSDSRDGVGMAYTAYIYFISKIIELLDTVFFVMRKKFNQITVLHLTHHAAVAWLMFWGVKYYAGGHGSFQGFVNSFVHIFVYSYYLLAALGPRVAPFLWWKRYLTQLQMIQFVVIFLHAFQLIFQPSCPYPRWILYPYCGVAAYLLLMFANFYSKSYLMKSSCQELKKPEDQAGSAVQVDSEKMLPAKDLISQQIKNSCRCEETTKKAL
jgi:hypothetical protein